MQPTRQAKLEARVQAVNTAHLYANSLYDLMAAAYKPLIGQDIFKADGTMFQKVEKLLPAVPESPRIHVYRDAGRYSIRYGIRAWHPIPGSNDMTYEISVYIADITGGKIEKLYDPPAFRTDFTAGEIADKRQAYKDAQKKADDAKSALWPFGESD